jgi:hypothetical protein
MLAGGVWLCLASGAQADAYLGSEVVRVGQVAPETGGGTFAQILHTRVNAAGDVAFYARVSSGGAQPGGIFVREGPTLRKLVMPGDPAPPPAVGEFYFFAQAGMDLNDAGDLVFAAMIRDDSSGFVVFRDAIVFRAAGGPLSVIAVEDGPAPDAIGGTYTGFGGPALNSHGDAVFFAGIDSGSSPRAIVVVSQGASRVVAARGDPAPRTDGGSFVEFDDHATIDDTGNVLFRASINGGSVTHGVFVHSAGGLTALALPGDPAPAILGGALAYLPLQPSLSLAGVAVLPALVATPTGDVYALLSSSGGELQLILKEGDPAPGGGIYDALAQAPAIAPSGSVSFTSAIVNGNAGAFLATPVPAVSLASVAFRVAAAAALLITGSATAGRGRRMDFTASVNATRTTSEGEGTYSGSAASRTRATPSPNRAPRSTRC